MVSGTLPIAASPTPPRSGRGGTFRALRHRNYKLWFFGQGVSMIGTWMQQMAQQVLVYRLTGSAASLGLINFMGLVPVLTLALFGGTLADRFPKRKVLLVTQSGMMILAFTLAALTITGVIQVWMVYVMAFLLGCCQAINMPTQQSFVVEMVDGKEDLTNAIALNSALMNSARALGPALSGMAVAAVGEGLAFFANGLSFVAVLMALVAMRNLPPPRPRRNQGNLRSEMSQGVRFIAKNQTIMVLMSLVALSALLSQPYNTLMPVMAGTVLKDSAQPIVNFVCGGDNPIIHCVTPQALPLGMLLTMVGIGAVTGALLVASLPNNARRGPMLTIGNIGFPLMLVFFSQSRSFVLSMLVLFFVGMSFVWQNSLANTMLQLIAPDELRGRIMSVYSMMTQSMQRVGGLQAGFTADRLGANMSIGGGAAICLLYGLFIALRYPKVRRMA